MKDRRLARSGYARAAISRRYERRGLGSPPSIALRSASTRASTSGAIDRRSMNAFALSAGSIGGRLVNDADCSV
ncbi:MAG: hypothetical protein DMG01_09245 [Acidobacteria bacterium]|nr:MAG: hypothetical protein DMG01_09245 [Acidobacteriota bacterium]